jgi:hypothetical protein
MCKLNKDVISVIKSFITTDEIFTCNTCEFTDLYNTHNFVVSRGLTLICHECAKTKYIRCNKNGLYYFYVLQ